MPPCPVVSIEPAPRRHAAPATSRRRGIGIAAAMLAGALGLVPQAGRAADHPWLDLPIACTPGADCVVQNYFDHDPGPGWRDHMCGALTYDGHDGIDFRIPSLAAMRRGVAVRAALDGTVAAVRDGEPDTGLSAGREAIAGKECGNAVRIAHADGWMTLYCHMARGSIAVKEGDKVAAGQTIGRVGLSGNTAFPHLHLTVMHDGRRIDPFAVDRPTDACGTADPMWKPGVATLLAYRDRFVLNAGFSETGITQAGIDDEAYGRPLATTSPAIAAYVRLVGVVAGDEIALEIRAPDGRPIARSAQPAAARASAGFMLATAAKSNGRAWPTGTCAAVLRIVNTGRIVTERRFETTIAP